MEPVVLSSNYVNCCLINKLEEYIVRCIGDLLFWLDFVLKYTYWCLKDLILKGQHESP